jgi:hypothetical protein
LGFIAFLFVTNAGIASPPTGDALDYRDIALAAPGLPPDEIGSAYTGRFAVHYGVGALSSGTGLSLNVAYGIALAAVLVALLAVVRALLRESPLGQFAIAAGLFVLSPYALRVYLEQEMLLQDLVFVVGVGVCLVGLRRRRIPLVLVGLAVAVLGRQSAIAVAPVAALWILADPRWRAAVAIRSRWAVAAASVLLTAALFAAVKVFTAGFTHDYEPSLLRDSVLNLVGELPGAAPELAAHVARTAVPWIVPAAVIVTLIVCVGVRRVEFSCWACLLIAVSIAAQPLMIDPGWPGFEHNEQRLAALGLLPLACAAADLLRQCRGQPMTRNRMAMAVTVLAVGSLHHEFSLVGPASLEAFLVLQVIVAVGVSWLVVRDNQPPPPPPRLLRGAGCRVYRYQPEGAAPLAHGGEFGIGLLAQ